MGLGGRSQDLFVSGPGSMPSTGDKVNESDGSVTPEVIFSGSTGRGSSLLYQALLRPLQLRGKMRQRTELLFTAVVLSWHLPLASPL